MYTSRITGLITFLTLLCIASIQAQAPLEWKGQQVTIIEDYWYPDGEKGESEFWQRRTIRHDENGKPVSGEFKHRDDGIQLVDITYNDQGDIESRVYKINDTIKLDYHWKYKYDEQGRMTERTNFLGTTKLLSQLIKIYDDAGNLTDNAGFFTNDLGYESWSFMDDEDGARIQDPAYLRYGSRHIYYNWQDRIFAEELSAFSILPGEEVFQRFKFLYDEEDKLDSTKTYDKSRNMVEKGKYFYDGRGRVRSIMTHNYMDSVAEVWDLHYNNKTKARYRTRIVDVKDPSDQKEIYAAEWLYEDGAEVESPLTLKEFRSKKINAIHDYYVYKEGALIIREKRDLFDDLLERWTYDDQGRITEWRKYGT
ncbi:MAG: hypothetical protein ACI959_001081, partial [Limisphaerales bacterium]